MTDLKEWAQMEQTFLAHKQAGNMDAMRAMLPALNAARAAARETPEPAQETSIDDRLMASIFGLKMVNTNDWRKYL